MCFIWGLKDVTIVEKLIQLVGIPLEKLKGRRREKKKKKKKKSTYLYERETSHNENNLYITQQVTAYRHLYKGLSSYGKVSERKVSRKWI